MVDVSAALTHGRLGGAADFMFHLSRRAVNVCERREMRSWDLAASDSRSAFNVCAAHAHKGAWHSHEAASRITLSEFLHSAPLFLLVTRSAATSTQ